MKLISYDKFGKLRLSDFFPGKKLSKDPKDPGEAKRFQEQIVELDNWEFMNKLWIGEAIGFTEWLRLRDDPTVLRSISIDFSDLPGKVSKAILKRIDLALRPGMTLDEIKKLLGKPTKSEAFVKDRKSFSFSSGDKEKYLIDCTIHDSDGLIYLVILRSDYRVKRKPKKTKR
jgi:hypothetical protein